MRRFIEQTLAILAKEVLVELRTREIIYTTLLFGAIIVVIFAFGFFERSMATQAAPGVLWIAILFAGTISINRTFEREREGGCMAGLMLVPSLGYPLFFGKLLANILFLLALEAMVAPLVFIIFQFSTVPNMLSVIAALTLGIIGYASLGTLVGSMIGHVRMRSVILPLVLFPLVIPLFGVGVSATSMMLSDQTDGRDYLLVLVAIDMLLLNVSAWLFARLNETI